MSKVKTKLLANVKVNKKHSKIGESIEIEKEIYDELLKKNLVSEHYEEIADPIKDLSELSADELKKYKVDDLKAFLDEKEISYESKATKDELISLIAGE